MRQARTPGGRWASGAMSGDLNTARLKFASVVSIRDVPAALRVARVLQASGYGLCDLHFVCVDSHCHKELVAQGLPSVLSGAQGLCSL